jgi:hypothetical protein
VIFRYVAILSKLQIFIYNHLNIILSALRVNFVSAYYNVYEWYAFIVANNGSVNYKQFDREVTRV